MSEQKKIVTPSELLELVKKNYDVKVLEERLERARLAARVAEIDLETAKKNLQVATASIATHYDIQGAFSISDTTGEITVEPKDK